MRFLLAALALAGLGSTVAAAAAAPCDLTQFGVGASRTCVRAEASCLPASLPDEVKQLGRAVVIEWVGLFVNDGRARWRALDLDRRELLVVQRYAGRQLNQAPSGDGVRRVRQGGAEWVDQVKRYTLTPAQFDDLACPAAGLWAAQPAPSRALTDMASRLILLQPQSAQVDMALGRFDGVVAELERAMVAAEQAPSAAASAAPR
jgi:hypothetical protein